MCKRIFLLALLLFAALMGCSANKPATDSKAVEGEITFVAPSSPGGSWDLTARAMQKTLNKQGIIEEPVQVINIIGAGGERGWKHVKEQQENVLAMNSSLILTSYLLGESQLTYQDFTPLATLSTEWIVTIVPEDSAINSAKELMEALKKNVHQYKIGVSPKLGNDDQLSFVLASQNSGIPPQELNFFVYENSSLVVDALLAKEVDAATMPLSEAKAFYESGNVKVLAVSSPERSKEMPDVPTWTEQGIDLVFQHWRGVMGPPNMTKAEIKYWDQAFQKMTQTEQWRRFLRGHHWTSLYKNSDETAAFLEEQSQLYEELMRNQTN
ncbi:tripartite tricarboxylate transporter substrate binding protein [Bacillus thermotolerans]|uniref:tripartite tricarboxylate transporter substrate binding protein n=1 Tax=Bacillus thermotolerans TaxID=1221996 RepID=UPI00057F7DCB|nr:tripartite tricarboxylate transporter substrate-binding protein [Bacillus thermotolerans]KKB36038.1 Phosphonate ABC transporter phosphate-binding periplasmic component [Bacillus thermotolerans]